MRMKNLSALIIYCSFLFTLVGCASVPKTIVAKNLHGKQYVSLDQVARYYNMDYRHAGGRFSLSSKWTNLVCYNHKRDFYLNKNKVHLAFPPTLYGGKGWISALDFQYVIDPILRKESLAAKNVRHIVLDPGHGGKDQGTRGERILEKDLALEVCKRLSRQLTARGFKVTMTRYGDSYPTLQQRAKIGSKGDLFISVHANAASASVHGIESFVLPPKGGPSTSTNKVVNSSEKGHPYARESVRLGYELQRYMVAHTQARDRGLKHARFLVLRETAAPSVLIELGFLSNANEERKLGTASYQNKLVDGLLKGIVKYANDLQRKR